jgi:hypothetical protein
MRWKTLTLLILVALALGVGYTATFAQTNYTYTCSWQQDGVNTDAYTILVDGTAAVTGITATACTGTGAARICTSPLTMTQNVLHTVVIRSIGTFGQVDSDPLPTAPPGKALAVGVKK